ncbi:N-acetylmuramoyl-L-alanine amidase [bacterium]|nr:N-acetylmuramoyl-L-alanine amidase [bacterium]
MWKVVRGPLREWIGIVLHHGAANAKAERHDIQAYANFHTLPVAQGGRGYSDMGYHFGIEEDGGVWISAAGTESDSTLRRQLRPPGSAETSSSGATPSMASARWIQQRPGSHTKATKSLDGKIVMPAGVNSSCVGICFAGNFNDQELSRAAFESGVRLCVALLRGGIHESADVIYPHSRFQEKDCPGKRFPFEEFVRTVSVELRLRSGVTQS